MPDDVGGRGLRVFVDRLPAGPLLAGIAATLGTSAALAADATTTARAVAAFAVLGAAHGTVTTVGSPVVVRHFGRKSIGAVKGSLSTVGVGASGAGPAVVAVLAVGGDFGRSLWMVAAVAPFLAIAAWFARRPAWGIRR